MQKHLFFILTSITLIPFMALGMEPDFKRVNIEVDRLDQKRRLQEDAQTALAKYSRNNIPYVIVGLPQNEQITDNALFDLNPQWHQAKELPQEDKDLLLKCAISCHSRYHHYPALIALAVCIGANPNLVDDTTLADDELFLTRTAIAAAAYLENISLIKYLVEKGANLNSPIVSENALWPCNTPEIAQALIDLGADIELHKERMIRMCITASNADFLNFLLSRGKQTTREFRAEILQEVVCTYDEFAKQEAKLKVLLNHGADPFLKLSYRNGLHAAVLPRSNERFSQIIIDDYVQKQHAPFYRAQRAAFLTFLACFKKAFPTFYSRAFNKDLREYIFKKLLEPFAQCIEPQVRSFLTSMDDGFRTAFDIWPLESLNPKTWTYQKFLDSKKPNTP